MSVTKRGDSWQVRIKSKLLPKPFFFTFDDEGPARAYYAHIRGMLDRGVVPLDMMEAEPSRPRGVKLFKLIPTYKASKPGPAPSDLQVLDCLMKELGDVKTDEVTNKWADAWVQSMKSWTMEKNGRDNLAPSSIRKRVESLARVIDWHIRETTPADKMPPVNPLRTMPNGYSIYTRSVVESLPSGAEAKADNSRERRFGPGEEVRIRATLAGVRRHELPGAQELGLTRRERAWVVDPDLSFLFELIVNGGLRLREAYWVRADRYDCATGVLHVDGTKGHRGVIKKRSVPIVMTLRPEMEARCKGKVGLIFRFWDGDPDTLVKTTARLTAKFRNLFEYAGVPDMTEHDLRHEATCRWATMRDQSGRWMWSELEVCKIMGWTKLDMFQRYASLRSEDFANRLR